MVQYVDTNRPPAPNQAGCQLDIVRAGLSFTRRMVVKQDDTGRIIQKCFPKNLGRIDGHLAPGSLPEIMIINDAVARIQTDKSKDLPPMTPEPCNQVRSNGLGAVKDLRPGNIDSGDSSSQLKGGTDGRSFGMPDPGTTLEFFRRHPRNPFEATGLFQQTLGLRNSTMPPAPRPEQHRQQFRL
jgi:hypothetical protein